MKNTNLKEFYFPKRGIAGQFLPFSHSAIQQLIIYYDPGTLVQEIAFLSRFKTWGLSLVDDTSACRPLCISGATSETRGSLGFATETLMALPLCHDISVFDKKNPTLSLFIRIKIASEAPWLRVQT